MLCWLTCTGSRCVSSCSRPAHIATGRGDGGVKVFLVWEGSDSVLSIDCCCSEACVTGNQGVFAGRCAKRTKIKSKGLWLVEASYRSLKTSGFVGLSYFIFISLSFTVFFSHFSGKHMAICIRIAIGIIVTMPLTQACDGSSRQNPRPLHVWVSHGQARNPLTRNIWYTSEMH